MNSSEERIPGLGMAVAAEQMQTDEVFRVHAARLYPVAFRLTGNASDAEDLVQETFAKAFAAAGWFQLGTNLSAWLHCIMISAFITSCRRKRNEPLLVAGDAVGWQLPGGQARDGSAEDQVVGRQSDADLTAAMRALPDRLRVTAYLAGVEGRIYREIADLTGIPLGSVKSSLHRARCRLRAELCAFAPGASPACRRAAHGMLPRPDRRRHPLEPAQVAARPALSPSRAAPIASSAAVMAIERPSDVRGALIPWRSVDRVRGLWF